MSLVQTKKEIVWNIFLYDVLALIASYTISCFVIYTFSFDLVLDILIFSLVCLSVTLFLKTYENLWVVSIPFYKVFSLALLSYALFLPLHFVFFRYKMFYGESLCFGFFVAIALLVSPRFFSIGKHRKKLKENLIIIGYEKSIINYFYFLQSVDYEIEQAVILNYNGPDRKIGKTPVTSIEKCKKVSYLALIEDEIDEVDFLKIQDLCEKYDMKLYNMRLHTTWQT
jgi:FlaA1/EpsC-like NDP-sugar epimerase